MFDEARMLNKNFEWGCNEHSPFYALLGQPRTLVNIKIIFQCKYSDTQINIFEYMITVW